VSEVHIGCVVEGHGDVEAVPVLIRRVAWLLDPTLVVRLPAPVRTPKSKLAKVGELERAVDLAARKLDRPAAVFVLLDSDEDCPAQLGPSLLDRAQRARSDLVVAVVLAKREFEAWFLAAAASLAGHRGLPPNLGSPPDPEEVRDAKGWLGQRMGPHGYSPTLDQPALAATFDLAMARRALSFDKCYRDLERIIRHLAASDL
jgi:hypothetical protein